MKHTRLISLFLMLISLIFGCRKREAGQKEQAEVSLEQGPKSVQVADMTEVGKNLFVNTVIRTASANRTARVSTDSSCADTEVYAALPRGTVEVPNGVIASVTNNNSNKSINVGPAPRTAELPVGEYRIDSWMIERRDKEGNRWSLKGDKLGKKAIFRIIEGETVKLPIGEPVVSSLTGYKVDSTYRFGHLLKGQLGENIKITKNGGRPEPPKLKISSSECAYQRTLMFAYG
jgi:hypothetical protein